MDASLARSEAQSPADDADLSVGSTKQDLAVLSRVNMYFFECVSKFQWILAWKLVFESNRDRCQEMVRLQLYKAGSVQLSKKERSRRGVDSKAKLFILNKND